MTCAGSVVQVCQEELEAHDGVQQGKYTVGLGQRCMAFCGDQEDVVSMSLTAVHGLLEKHDVDPKSIGRQGLALLSQLPTAWCLNKGSTAAAAA